MRDGQGRVLEISWKSSACDRLGQPQGTVLWRGFRGIPGTRGRLVAAVRAVLCLRAFLIPWVSAPTCSGLAAAGRS